MPSIPASAQGLRLRIVLFVPPWFSPFGEAFGEIFACNLMRAALELHSGIHITRMTERHVGSPGLTMVCVTGKEKSYNVWEPGKDKFSSLYPDAPCIDTAYTWAFKGLPYHTFAVQSV